VTSAPRYADLRGKAAIVAGEGDLVVEVVGRLAAHGCLLAVVAADRGTTTRATEAAESQSAAVFGITADPADAATWDRVIQHIEQRLGPIDIAVAVCSTAVHDVLRAALTHDMAARRRGVLICVGAEATADPIGTGVRHVVLATDDAAAVVRAASDSAQDG